jgi:branched-chain amino acid transport system ATP-binding protein
VLRIRNLRCGYGSLEVIKGISLHVERGEIVALIGANGAGKSSLLASIVGLLPPWGGSIMLDGRETSGMLAWRCVSHGVVLVPEGRQLFPDMSVHENLIVGGFRNKDRAVDIDRVLERFPRLRERSAQLAGTLSGGEQQMLAIARALVARPRLLLLDEPSMGLAPLIVRDVFAIVRELRDLGSTIFLVEQNAVMALGAADRGYVLETGEVVLEGTGADLMANPDVKRAYLGKAYKEVWE